MCNVFIIFILVEKMLKLEKLYAEESSIRMSLEQNLNEVSSFLDETQYNAIPLKVRESIEKSLRLSCNFSRSRESLSQDGDNQSWKENLFPPANITQIESEDDVSFRSTGKRYFFKNIVIKYFANCKISDKNPRNFLNVKFIFKPLFLITDLFVSRY